MTSVHFLRPAEVEMMEAALFYEEQTAGLGQLFVSALEIALRSIVENPKAWPILRNDIRKRIVSRFPYSILYRTDGEKIVILAVMHQRRRPNYWLDRW